MKEKNKTILVICSFVFLTFAWVYTGIEREPTFQPYLTTFDGKEALGQLHRDQTYTFSYFHRVGNITYQDSEICTVPVGEAVKLH